MIPAYIDESGTHQGSKVLTISGYIGAPDVWNSVEARFKRADKYAGVPFHAVDCAQGGKDYRGMDNSKRYRITKKMVKIVNDHAIYGASSGMWIEDYQAVYPRGKDEQWESWLSHPFALMFQDLLFELGEYLKRHFPGKRMSVAMEDSPHWYPVAAKKFLSMKQDDTEPFQQFYETIAPYSPRDAVQLYAPDLLAYESYLFKTRQRYPTKHTFPREPMLTLLKKRIEGRMWDKNNFKQLKVIIDECEGKSRAEVIELLKVKIAAKGI